MKYSFWKIVEIAKTNAGIDWESRPESLREILLTYQPEEILQFNSDYRAKLNDSYLDELWEVANAMHGRYTDDGFDYFCDFLISEGRDVFEAALIDPRILLNKGYIGFRTLELYRYAMGKAYEELTGMEIPN